MQASFAISTHRSNCCEVIKLAGDLDLARDDQLRGSRITWSFPIISSSTFPR